MLLSTSLLLLVVSCIRAAVISRPHDIHDHHENDVYDKRLPDAWHQPSDHPVHSLFRRAPDDGTSYAAVGTPAWSSTFPPPGSTPNSNLTPPAWIAVLNAAVRAGKIPNIPTSPYPPGVDPNSPQVCSAAVWCKIPGDIFDGVDSVFASSFDDGPYPQTAQLVTFLQAQNVTTTHFMIGGNIILNPNNFLQAFNAGHDMAVHTWSHPHMTTLTNEQVVAELGWTMELIHNSTGGRVPRYWRPPYGDSDMRTRAIAREVFGLQTVIWNSDTGDWTSGSPQQVAASLTQIVATRPKSSGLVTLEHEISDSDVAGFIAAFPSIAANGWKFQSLAKALNDGRSYQNADSSTSDVRKKDILAVDPPSLTSSMPTPTSTSAPAATSAVQRASSSSSSLLLSHKSPCSLFFLSSIILSSVMFLIL